MVSEQNKTKNCVSWRQSIMFRTKITRYTTGARGCHFQTSANQVYKASLNKISRNMLHVMRIEQRVSNIMFAHKICLQVLGTKYPVISTSNQGSGTKSN